jgi:hypothetical protein
MMQTPSSPLQPVAPPSKKQRSSTSSHAPLRGGGRDPISAATDDAIAKRRAELRRLQQMQLSRAPGGSGTNTANDLMEQARNQLSGGGAGRPPSLVSSFMNSSTALSARAPPQAPAIPPPRRMLVTRHSDIFPTAPKVAPSTGPPKVSATPAIQEAVQAPPPTTSKKDESGRKVARKLDSAFSNVPLPASEELVSRHKSAPPMRPPAPPLPPRLVAEAPASLEMRRAATPVRPPPIRPLMSDTRPLTSPASETAQPTTDNRETPPSTVRRDFLRSMREFADTPPSEKGSNQFRMMQELKKAQQDKEDAFRKVARLQEQMHQLQKQENSKKELEALLEVANQRGDAAALQCGPRLKSLDRRRIRRQHLLR